MSVSVIIPTLNEESCLGDTLACLRRHNPGQIIVVDGGSRDATLRIAGDADVVAHSPPGRAVQMNTGAAHATGDVLLFLHADCSLEEGALAEAEKVIRKPRVMAGCFTMEVQARGIFYRSIDYCASARVRLTGLVFGDQGLFLLRDRFINLGGFPDLRLMEDLYLSKKLRRLGKIAVASSRILVSPRRWRQAGLARQSLRNWTLTALAAAGVPPDQLADYYPNAR